MKTFVTEHERYELAFIHKVADAAELFYNIDNENSDPKKDLAFRTGEAIQVMADLMIQRFNYSEMIIFDTHHEELECEGPKETKKIFTAQASNNVTTHVQIGMLNHNVSMLNKVRDAYPEAFEIVWSIYKMIFSEVYKEDSVYLQRAFFEYSIEIDYKSA